MCIRDRVVAVGGADAYQLPAAAIVTITDNDAYQITFTETALSLAEGSSMATTLSVAPTPSTDLTIRLNTRPNNGQIVISDADDRPLSEQTMTFTEGSDKAAITITVLDDSVDQDTQAYTCLLYTSPSPRDRQKSRMPSSA